MLLTATLCLGAPEGPWWGRCRICTVNPPRGGTQSSFACPVGPALRDGHSCDRCRNLPWHSVPRDGVAPPLWGAAGFDFTILTTWCDASRWLLGAFLALMIAMMMYFDDVDKYY